MSDTGEKGGGPAAHLPIGDGGNDVVRLRRGHAERIFRGDTGWQEQR